MELLLLLVFVDVAAIYPNFNTNGSVSSVGCAAGKINVSAKSVQWDFARREMFSTGNFSTVQTSTDRNLYTFSARLHNLFYRLLHQATESNTLFNLFSNAVSNH